MRAAADLLDPAATSRRCSGHEDGTCWRSGSSWCGWRCGAASASPTSSAGCSSPSASSSCCPPAASRPRYVFRPVAFVRLVVYFVRQLVVANAALTREIVTAPRPDPHRRRRRADGAGISDGLLIFVANVTALTPGTMPIEVRRDPPDVLRPRAAPHDVEAVRRRDPPPRAPRHPGLRFEGRRRRLDRSEPRRRGRKRARRDHRHLRRARSRPASASATAWPGPVAGRPGPRRRRAAHHRRRGHRRRRHAHRAAGRSCPWPS